MRFSDGYYSVRERSPDKEAFPAYKGEVSRKSPYRKFEITTEIRFTKLAKQWGQVMATSHTRADKNLPYSLPKQLGKLTKGHHKAFEQLVREVAFGYASQVEVDWGYFTKGLAPKDCSK